jgi:hypothetical protein
VRVVHGGGEKPTVQIPRLFAKERRPLTLVCLFFLGTTLSWVVLCYLLRVTVDLSVSVPKGLPAPVTHIMVTVTDGRGDYRFVYVPLHGEHCRFSFWRYGLRTYYVVAPSYACQALNQDSPSVLAVGNEYTLEQNGTSSFTIPVLMKYEHITVAPRKSQRIQIPRSGTTQ